MKDIILNVPSSPRVIEVEESILGKNQHAADQNRRLLREHGILAVNLMSSPGSGKTALLETLLGRLQGQLKAAVIVGDCATDNDGRRLAGRDAHVVQITTGGYCHLDAEMTAQALAQAPLPEIDILFIENVGNLVCPASFDLGEDFKIALLSVTEGEDKPLKYPSLFSRAAAVIVNKIDLAAAAEWDRERAMACLRDAAPGAAIFEASAKKGIGIDALLDWLRSRMQEKRRIPR